jgi:hypothetical protein
VGESQTQFGCFATDTESSVVATIVQENLTPTPVTSKGPITVVAAPLYMVWQAKDVSLHTGRDAASLQAVMGTDVVFPTSQAIATYYPVSSRPVSVAAEIGIAVGFSICLIAIAILGYFACSRRWKRPVVIQNEPWTDDRAMSAQAGAPAMSSEASDRQWTREPGESRIKLQSFVEHNSVVEQSPAEGPRCREGDEWQHGVEQKMLLR